MGDIFLAFPGAKVHGAQFIDSAIARGAVAVLTDQAGADQSSGFPTLIVKDVREAGAVLASSFYRSPIRDMQSIGITGTNGKTTITTLLYQLLSAVGRETGLIGTVETRITAMFDGAGDCGLYFYTTTDGGVNVLSQMYLDDLGNLILVHMLVQHKYSFIKSPMFLHIIDHQNLSLLFLLLHKSFL